MRIYLIGYMSSGKSTLGKALATKLKYKFLDIDHAFEEKYKITINDFFERYGEDKFRELEHKLLISSFENDDIVVSTGGGTPCFFDNMELINANATSVYLKLHYKSVISRLKSTKKKRPLVKDKSNEEFEQYIEQHLESREIYYSKAHFTIKTENLTASDLFLFIKENLHL